MTPSSVWLLWYRSRVVLLLMFGVRLERLGVDRHIHVRQRRADRTLDLLGDGMRVDQAQTVIEEEMVIH